VLEPTPEVSSLVTILGVWIEEIPKLKQIKQHLQGKSDKITFLISGDGSERSLLQSLWLREANL
jgi:hypothetical protein